MNITEANNFLLHLQRITGHRPIAQGPAGPYPQTWASTDDEREIICRIDSTRSHHYVICDDRCKDLVAFGDHLRDQLARGEV